MKNLLALFLLITLLAACNSNSGNVAETQDSTAQLLQSFRDSIKKYPDDTLLKYNLMLTLQDAGKYKEAVNVLDSLNIGQTDSTDLKNYFGYLYKRAELLVQAGDTAGAIKTLELFVIPGEITEAGLILTNLYAETKNPKALVLADEMIKNDLSKADPNPDYLKGAYYYNIGDFNKALSQFNKSISKDYTFLDAYMEKGRILYKQQHYQEAIEVYDIAISVSNRFADAHYWKGLCEEALGKVNEAKISYQRAYAFDKTLTEAKEAADRIKN